MQQAGSSNPHDVSLHKQVKEMADLLKPELQRLYQLPEEVSADVKLYTTFLEKVQVVKKEMACHDALFALENVINHTKKAIAQATEHKRNKEILLHLQEVMALLFKIQTLPS